MLKIGFGFLISFMRWRILIHGGIARFSRLSVYLCASNNNKASTVLHVFEKAVNEYALYVYALTKV